jgi:hypothetical protein
MTVKPTVEQRAAFERAAALIEHQAEGLRLTGSQTTQAALKEYGATMRRLATGAQVEVDQTDRLHLENATFVLEGIRDGLLTTEFRERAAAIDKDIKTLNGVVAAYNASPDA